ncbi:MAG: Rpn family recombination-promoting nuclease/putative transposase [Alphaproteobacteria bacterium]|nr:Rpn family recombination-promoting nuclease/putative transposase [Alphaproteobacteria bacterium]
MSETTLLDIQSDYIFKRVFGVEKNKKLLISLINSILKGNPTVTDLEIRNTEISKIVKNNLTIYLDIKAEINPQEFVDIEIQVRNTGEIMERAVQYLAEILTLNCRKLTDKEKEAGQRQTYKYPKVIGIWIMGENVTDRKDAVNEACVAFPPTERDEYQIITDKLRIFFVELQKFHPKHIDRKNMLDVWMAFLKNPLNDDIQDVPEVKEALDTLKEISADKDEREIYYLRQHTEFGYISEKNVAVAQALEKGKKLEREKAQAEKIETARNFLKMGLSVEQVAQGTGLSIEEVNKL